MTRSALLSGPGLMAVGAVVVVAGLAVFTLLQRNAPPVTTGTGVALPVAQVPPPPVAAPVIAAPEIAAPEIAAPVRDAAAGDTPAAKTPTPEAPPLGMPRISLVTVAPDGSTQVAGFAEPGATVEILIDGAPVGTVRPGHDGAFYLALTVPGSDAARALTLRATRDAEAALSDDLVLIQPVLATPETPADADLAAAPSDTSPVVAATDAAAPAQTPAGIAKETPGEDPTEDAPTEAAALVVAAEQTSAPAILPPAVARATAGALTSAPALISATPEGVRVTQPAVPANTPPEVMASVALDSIAYSEAGDVQLTGRGGGQADSFVRVYLDNRALITLPIAADGSWRTDLPQIDSGVYTLRVDQIDSAGQVTSRVETPFKREDPVALNADVQLAQAITVQPGSTLWAIARDRYGEGTLYLRVFEANRDRIRNPDLIYPGQVFDLPE